MKEDDGGSAVSIYYVEIVRGARALFLKDFNIQIYLIYWCLGLCLPGGPGMDGLTSLGLS